jgi:hypothetical protein
MVEAYAFLAMFTVQVLAMSVLQPARFIRYLRVKINPAEPDAQLYVTRRLTQYRALNMGIAVLGLLLLGWLFNYAQRPKWDEGHVSLLVTVYFMLQVLPLCLVGWIVAGINKALTRSLPKRKASLQRRGLFDFVSPATIVLAALVYFLFAALVFYIARDPFPGFAGPLINIGIVTLGYAFVSLGVYKTLYRTRSNPLETQADRMHSIGLGVKVAIYCCIGAVVFVSLNMTLALLDLKRWEPVALSVFYVAMALALAYSRSAASPRQPDAAEPGSHGRLTPGTRNSSA